MKRDCESNKEIIGHKKPINCRTEHKPSDQAFRSLGGRNHEPGSEIQSLAAPIVNSLYQLNSTINFTL